MEERQLHERHQLAKRQLKDLFFLQRHQMLVHHEKELEHLKRMMDRKEEELIKNQTQERKALPKRIRQEMKAREMMFRESMRISTTNLHETLKPVEEKDRLKKVYSAVCLQFLLINTFFICLVFAQITCIHFLSKITALHVSRILYYSFFGVCFHFLTFGLKVNKFCLHFFFQFWSVRGSISRAFSFSRSSFAQESWYNTVGIILFFKKIFFKIGNIKISSSVYIGKL